jgi:hypothetical protein
MMLPRNDPQPRTTVMMGLNDIDAAQIMGIVVIAVLLVSFVWRLYIGETHDMHGRRPK